jgi:hypothetical protein
VKGGGTKIRYRSGYLELSITKFDYYRSLEKLASSILLGLRAEAVAWYFLCAERFADLLVVFHMPAACARE